MDVVTLGNPAPVPSPAVPFIRCEYPILVSLLAQSLSIINAIEMNLLGDELD